MVACQQHNAPTEPPTCPSLPPDTPSISKVGNNSDTVAQSESEELMLIVMYLCVFNMCVCVLYIAFYVFVCLYGFLFVLLYFVDVCIYRTPW